MPLSLSNSLSLSFALFLSLRILILFLRGQHCKTSPLWIRCVKSIHSANESLRYSYWNKMAAAINNICEIYKLKGRENLLVQYSTVVLARWKACRFAFFLLETGVVGSDSMPGHRSVPALVLCKYRPPGIPTPRAALHTTLRIHKLGKREVLDQIVVYCHWKAGLRRSRAKVFAPLRCSAAFVDSCLPAFLAACRSRKDCLALKYLTEMSRNVGNQLLTHAAQHPSTTTASRSIRLSVNARFKICTIFDRSRNAITGFGSRALHV